MCNLYSLTPKEDDVGRFFRVSHNRRAAFKPVNAIFPRHVAPVVRQSEASLHFRNTMQSGPGGKQIQFEDPDGNPIEFFEPAQRSL